MPGINGIETMRRLHAFLSGVRVVILTILDSDSYRAAALAAGACAFVAKPQMHTQLLPILDGLLQPLRRPESLGRSV